MPPHNLDIDQVRAQLPARRIDWFATIGSTMDEAARLAAAGCPHGAAVVAEEQTAGQGRHGRRWHSEPGAGLYVSVVLRVALPADSLPVLTLALAPSPKCAKPSPPAPAICCSII